jgi:hypothetical protein
MRSPHCLALCLVALSGCQVLAVEELTEPIVGGVIDTGDPAVVLFNGRCTAALVSPRVLVTAAHCVVPPPMFPTIFTGVDDRTPASGKRLAVVQVHPHPGYNDAVDRSPHDIAVGILKTPQTIPPIALNRTPLSVSLIGKPVRLIGYGVTTTSGPDDFGVRRQASAPLIGFDSEWVDVGDANGNQCYGDSGGPALMTVDGVEVMVGVDSFGHDAGPTCLKKNSNTRVDAEIAFIESYVKVHDPGFVLPGAAVDGGSDGAGGPVPAANGDGGSTPVPGSKDGGNGLPPRQPTMTAGGCQMSGGAESTPVGLLWVPLVIALIQIVRGRRLAESRQRLARAGNRSFRRVGTMSRVSLLLACVTLVACDASEPVVENEQPIDDAAPDAGVTVDAASPPDLASLPPLVGTPISSLFFGQNAWMPAQIGTVSYGGKLEQQWPAITASGVQVMRYGGIAVDENYNASLSPAQYLSMVDAMRQRGIEPILQVPFDNGNRNATEAANLVRYINTTMKRNVRYWTIGNEPNLGYGHTTAAQVAAYFRPFASAMKAVDPTIKIIGPDPAWYDTRILNGATTPLGPDDLTGRDASGHFYVDVIAFHTYPFDGAQTRAQVTAELQKPGGFDQNLAALKIRIDNCNAVHGRTGDRALQMAVTEGNIDYKNPPADGAGGVGATSFLGGQFWAEMMGIAMKHGVAIMTFWSVIEGLNIGYLRNTGTPLPAYYHFQMMAHSFRGVVVASSDNQPNVKTYASRDHTQIAVILLNQELSTELSYTVRLDLGALSGVPALAVHVDAGVPREYSGTMAAQSTVLLVFDAAGALQQREVYQLAGQADQDKPPAVFSF